MSVDIILPGGKAFGDVAQALVTGGLTVNSLRTNATLRKEEWLQFDQRVVEVSRQRLRAVGDLLSAGLTYDIPNAMGTTIVEWETQSDMDPAIKSMDGVERSQDDRILWNRLSLPVYITHKDFSINLRALEASRKLGQPLDTTQAAVCARKVSEDLETTLLNGAGNYQISGATSLVHGYTSFPQRNTYEFQGNLTWSAASKTGENILADVLGMIAVLEADNMFGPYILYIPTAYSSKLEDDFKANSDRTIRERLMAIGQIQDIRTVDYLGADQVVMVQMTSDVVDELVGFQPTTVQWESNGGFKHHFKVMSIMIPRVKADYDGRCGICHGSPASGGGG